MFQHHHKREFAMALGAFSLAMVAGLLAINVGCYTKSSDTDVPKPVISDFQVSVDTGFTKSTTTTPNGNSSDFHSVNVSAGSSIYFRAAYATNAGDNGVIAPANLPIENNAKAYVTLSNVSATTTYTLTVSSSDGRKATYSVQVNVFNPPTSITYTNEDATYYKDVQIPANNITANNGTGPFTYSVTPALPQGLRLNAATGAITGTPTATAARAPFTIKATDPTNTSFEKVINLAVNATPVSFAVSPLAVLNPTDSGTLSWDVTSVSGLFKAVSIRSTPTDATLVGTSGLSGSASITPGVTTVYTLTADITTGGTYTQTLTFYVGALPVALQNFIASPTTVVPSSGTTTLSWSTGGGIPTSLTLNGDSVLGLTSTSATPTAPRSVYTLSGLNEYNGGVASKATTSVGVQGAYHFAGSTAAGGCIDGIGTSAKFVFDTAYQSSPTAATMNLSTDPAGNIYIADMSNHVVRMMDGTTGQVTTLAGKPGVSWVSAALSGDGSGNGSAARFNKPTQVLYWDANTLYVTDFNSHTLRRLDKQSNGTWTVSLAAGTPGVYAGGATGQNLDNPCSMVKYNNKIYIMDMYFCTIRTFDPAITVGDKISDPIAGAFGYADGTGTAGLMRDPSSFVVDPSNGDMYVADRQNHAIRKITQAGVVTTIAGALPVSNAGTAGAVDGAGTAARFNRPAGIARDASGNLYVSDYGNHLIRKMVYNSGPSTWDVTTIAGDVTLTTPTAGFVDGTGAAIRLNCPQGITVDSAGNVYVADAANSHIRKLTPSGSPVTYASSSFSGNRQMGLVNTSPATSARFMAPSGVAIDKDGVIYIADEGNQVIRKIATNGTVSTWGTGATLTAPYTLCVDDSYNVYVLDRQATTSAIVKINASGAMSTLTLSGVAPALGNGCRGIAVSKDGSSLYVANGNNIHQFNASGAQVNVLSTDLSSVNGLAVANDGVYWVEYGSQTVKKAAANLSGATLVAGKASTKGFVDGAATSACFNQPVALALAVHPTTGNATKIYVVDQANHALRLVDLSAATVTTLVGIFDSSITGGVPCRLGAIEGTLSNQPNSTAGLYYPKGVGIHPTTGDLYVSTSDGIMQVVPLP